MKKQLKLRFTQHALFVLKERQIPIEWVERVLNQPEKILTDKENATLRHALSRIPEFDNRVLRVIFSDEIEHIRVITVYFDRQMRNKL